MLRYWLHSLNTVRDVTSAKPIEMPFQSRIVVEFRLPFLPVPYAVRNSLTLYATLSKKMTEGILANGGRMNIKRRFSPKLDCFDLCSFGVFVSKGFKKIFRARLKKIIDPVLFCV